MVNNIGQWEESKDYIRRETFVSRRIMLYLDKISIFYGGAYARTYCSPRGNV